MFKRPDSLADLPPHLPVLPLSGALLLPFSHRPLNIFEPRYIELIDNVLGGNRLLGLIQPEDASEESPRGRTALQKIGTVGRLTHWEEHGEGRYFIILEGVARFELTSELTVMTPYRQAVIDTARFGADFTRAFGEAEVDRPRFLKMMKDYAEFANFELNWDEINKTGTADLVNFACMVSPYGAREKQVLLEASSLADRAETLIALAEVEMAKGSSSSPSTLN
jgi:Lon protease-like protein